MPLTDCDDRNNKTPMCSVSKVDYMILSAAYTNLISFFFGLDVRNCGKDVLYMYPFLNTIRSFKLKNPVDIFKSWDFLYFEVVKSSDWGFFAFGAYLCFSSVWLLIFRDYDHLLYHISVCL